VTQHLCQEPPRQVRGRFGPAASPFAALAGLAAPLAAPARRARRNRARRRGAS
jgi:hypothetical protein